MTNFYPWKLMLRKVEVTLPLGLFLLATVGLLVWMGFRGAAMGDSVFLHYSVETGVDAVGSRWALLWLPGLAFCLGVINVVVVNWLLLRERVAALVVAWGMLPIAAIIWFVGWLLGRVNGV